MLNHISHHYRQIKQLWPLFLKIYIPVLFVLIFLALQPYIPAELLTRDTSAIIDAPFYAGLLSNIGILLWSATVALYLFTAFVVKRLKVDGLENHHKVLFLLSSGLLSFVFMLDDLFLIHEVIFPQYLNIPSKLLYIAYGTSLIVYICLFRHLLLSNDYSLGILTLVFFGISILLDMIADTPSSAISNTIVPAFDELNNSRYIFTNIKYLIEDGAKLLGILSWFLYCVRFCNKQLNRLIENGS